MKRCVFLVVLALLAGCVSEGVKQGIRAMRDGHAAVAVAAQEPQLRSTSAALAHVGDMCLSYTGQPANVVDIGDPDALDVLAVTIEHDAATKGLLSAKITSMLGGMGTAGAIALAVIGFFRNSKNRKALVATVSGVQDFRDSLKDDEKAVDERLKAALKNAQDVATGAREVIEGVKRSFT